MAVEHTVVEATIEEGIRNRRSVRGYLQKPVPPEVMREVFELAQRAPSGVNVQNWHVFVASGAALDRIRGAVLKRLMETGKPNLDYQQPPKLEGVYWDRQLQCGLALYGAMGLEVTPESRKIAGARNFQFFDAPHVAFVAAPTVHGYPGAVNVGIYAQTLMLALASRGIASCPMECAVWYPEVVRDEFEISEDLTFLVGCAFGYEDPEVPANACRTDRVPIDECVVFKDS
jgi:nitroreductase